MSKIYLLSFIIIINVLIGCNNHSTHSEHNHSHSSHENCGSDHDHAAHNHSKDSDHQSNHEDCSGHSHSTSLAESTIDEIIFTAEQAKAAGVIVENIYPGDFNQVISTSGQILTAQGEETTIVANVSGVVSFQKEITDGIYVNKGVPLFVLSSGGLLEGDPVARAKVNYETAKKEYERAMELVADQIISDREFNLIKEAFLNAQISFESLEKNQTSNGQIVPAPLNGYVKSILVNEGEYVEVGQSLLTISQNQRLYLRADVSERYYKFLKDIVSANFKTSYDDQIYELSALKGQLISYGRTSESFSSYIPVIFEFNNQGDIIPGSFVTVYLLSSPIKEVITLPRTALVEEQGLFFVYIQVDEEGYKKQPVKLGVDNGKEVQILSGINSGDRVVTKGAYYVKLASAVNALPAHSHEH